jgi:hypothetical protein
VSQTLKEVSTFAEKASKELNVFLTAPTKSGKTRITRELVSYGLTDKRLFFSSEGGKSVTEYCTAYQFSDRHEIYVGYSNQEEENEEDEKVTEEHKIEGEEMPASSTVERVEADALQLRMQQRLKEREGNHPDSSF